MSILCLHLYVLFFFLFSLVSSQQKPNEQSQANILRHTVIVGGLPSQFKQGSLLLSRDIARAGRVWSVINPFVKLLLSYPQNLDWYVADVNTDARDTVTINAGFSCVDLGKSTAKPLIWWTATSFEELEQYGNG